MKKLIFLLILSLTLNAQNWNNTEWLFYAPDGSDVSSCADKNAIHMIYFKNSFLKYVRISSDGTVELSDVSITTGSDIGYAKINSINGSLFVSYYKADKIRIAKSTNLGSTWSSNLSDYSVKNTGFNALETYVKEQDIHIAWSEKRIGDPNKYDTHYAKFNTSDPAWYDYKRVTDTETNGGEEPSIVVSSDRVHITYSQYYEIHNRDKIISTSQWQSTENVPYNDTAFVAYVPLKYLYTDDNYLRVVYKYVHSYWESIEYVGQAYRPISGGSWTQDATAYSTENTPITVQTADNKVHLFYYDAYYDENYHKTITGTTWTTVEIFNNLFTDITSAGNDIFRIYYEEIDHAFRYQQYDAAPLTPQNFSATTYNNHPKITWSSCNEPDVYNGGSIKVYRGYEDEVGFISYMLAATLSGNSTSWVDNEVTLSSPRTGTKYFYKVSSVDIGAKESPATIPIQIYGIGPLWKTGEDNDNSNIKTFSLSQNYPNPFNPSTTINYQIPKEGFVTLKIYDALGREVITLVSELKTRGRFAAKFDASSIASGVYIYTLKVNEFTQSRKMLLVK